jgi:hypothetical protein
LVSCRAIWSLVGPFGIFYDHLVNISRFGILFEEKSGNPRPSPPKLIRHLVESKLGMEEKRIRFFRKQVFFESKFFFESKDFLHFFTSSVSFPKTFFLRALFFLLTGLSRYPGTA